MIIGNGQLALAFKDLEIDNVLIFASGVADSSCIDDKEFEKEKKLLILALSKYKEKKFVYFSSCALSAREYPRNAYYQHKYHMEEIIKNSTDNYYIFRAPQLFGILKKHKTLINFIYNSIIDNKLFEVYNNAYRYVIEIDDLCFLVEKYLKFSPPGIVVDLANDYRYSIEDIVKTFEILLDMKVKYEIVEKTDGYILDLKDMNSFIAQHNIKIDFGSSYLKEKLKDKIGQE